MKKLLFTLILGTLSTGVFAQDIIKYPIEAATVEYVMSMFGTDNKMTTYFKDHGNIHCTDVELEMMGVKTRNRVILDRKTIYTLDMEKKTYKEEGVTEEQFKKSAQFMDDEEALAEEGFVKEGEEKFLGKNCVVFKMDKDGATTKFWAWEGLLLKMEASAQGMTMTMTAQSITEDEPDNMYFEIPSDFTKVE